MPLPPHPRSPIAAPRRAARRWALAVAVLAASLVAAVGAPAAVRAPADLRSAETLLGRPAGSDRDKALRKWAERAGLAELVWVLRRPPSELGGAEAALVAEALERTPPERAALRGRLAARLARVDPERAHQDRKRMPPVPWLRHPRASVFTVATLLPDSGGYEDFGRAVHEGIEAALAVPLPPAGEPARLLAAPTGADEPARVLDAFDRAAEESGALIGNLLSLPTLLIAAGARLAGLPLISPSAGDEAIGTAGRAVFQVGPSGYHRGAALARAARIEDSLRVGLLVSSATEGGSFARGFAETVRRLGGRIVHEADYAAGTLNFRDPARALAARKVELLFWDGDAREAEALVRQLTRDRMSVRICGGAGLAPERHHAEARVLLEGVQYVAEDWVLPDSIEARLDPAGATDATALGRLRARGWLAGVMLRDALRSGALCPEEVTSHLAARTERDPWLAERRFLDLAAHGARLPVFTVRRGRAASGQ